MRIASLLVAGAVLAGSAPFQDAAAQWRKRDRKTDNTRSPTPIACTPSGCAPIPPGCRIEVGFTPDGMLSGFDTVLCPVR